MTSVWPALWPPWKRTTTCARSESQSTTLPLPSSPHWEPITATLAIYTRITPTKAGGIAGSSAIREEMPQRVRHDNIDSDERNQREMGVYSLSLGLRTGFFLRVSATMEANLPPSGAATIGDAAAAAGSGVFLTLSLI